MLGNFACFCCRLLTFFQSELFRKILLGTLSECQTNLDPDQDRHTAGPDVGTNNLLRLSAYSKERVKHEKSTLGGKHSGSVVKCLT